MSNKMKKKPHTAAFKFKVAIAAIKGDKTTAELCQEYGIVSSQLFKWKKNLLERGEAVFEHGSSAAQGGETAQIDKLHATIGRLKVENDFLAKFAGRSQ